MFVLQRPTPQQLERLLHEAGQMTLSYEPVGMAYGSAPPGFRVEEAGGVLGSGDQVFAKAARAFDRWREFDLGWVDSYPSDAPLQAGTNVLVIAQHFGFYSVNACRILYRLGVGGPDGGVGGPQSGDPSGRDPNPAPASRRVTGFAYGTLTQHAEAGEEIFELSLDETSGEVAYRIRAVSRERALLAKLGFPIARAFQDRFRRDSVAAMQRAVTEDESRLQSPRAHPPPPG